MKPENTASPASDPQPELRVTYDSYGSPDDAEYVKERAARNKERKAGIDAQIKAFSGPDGAEKARKLVLASLQREQKRCEIERMEIAADRDVSDVFDEGDSSPSESESGD